MTAVIVMQAVIAAFCGTTTALCVKISRRTGSRTVRFRSQVLGGMNAAWTAVSVAIILAVVLK